jgi:transmembrane sensor
VSAIVEGRAVTASDPDLDIGSVQRQAIDWLVRMGTNSPSSRDQADLERWRTLSPDHEAAWQRASLFGAELKALPYPAEILAGNVVALPHRPRIDRRTALFGGSLAAIAASVVLLVDPPMGLWPSLAELAADHRTGTGQRLAFVPAPGVNVELNTRTSLSVAKAGRAVALIDGEAFLTIAAQRTPFEVETAGASLRATKARFAVQSLDEGLSVICADGSVSCTHAGHVVEIHQGEKLVLSSTGTTVRSRPDLSVALAWRRGLLIFDGTPLNQAVHEINRYFPGRLILTDSAATSRPVSGIFHIDHINLAVVQIEQLTGVSATYLPGSLVLLG